MISFLVLVFVSPFLPGQEARPRVALVVGNDQYRAISSLKNAANDARLISGMLEKSHQVDSLINAGLADFRNGLKAMEKRAKTAESLVFYFAGHGVEVKGVNYLLPVDCAAATIEDLRDRAIPLSELLEVLAKVSITSVVILDCCRDNPFDSGVLAHQAGVGLASVELNSIPGATLLVYSGAPGQTVPDGEGINSPFCEQFAAKSKNGLDVFSHFILMDKALKEQSPWVKYDGAVKSLERLSEHAILPGQLIDKWEAQGIQRLRIGDAVELKGYLARIKTYDQRGRPIYPFFLQTTHKLIARPGLDFDPGDTGKLIEGLEVQMIGGSNDAEDTGSPLEALNGKQVTVKGQLGTGLDFYGHPYGLFVKGISDIQKATEP